jgi:hypothetical protein
MGDYPIALLAPGAMFYVQRQQSPAKRTVAVRIAMFDLNTAVVGRSFCVQIELHSSRTLTDTDHLASETAT